MHKLIQKDQVYLKYYNVETSAIFTNKSNKKRRKNFEVKL